MDDLGTYAGEQAVLRMAVTGYQNSIRVRGRSGDDHVVRRPPPALADGIDRQTRVDPSDLDGVLTDSEPGKDAVDSGSPLSSNIRG